jgi:hypothetical protein
MALPFLKSDKRDSGPGAGPGFGTEVKERPTNQNGPPGSGARPMAANAASGRASDLAGFARSAAQAMAKVSRPGPSLTSINGGGVQASPGAPASAATMAPPAARATPSQDPEEVVRARLAALRANKTPGTHQDDIISVARYAKSMRERSRAAQYDRTKAMVGRIEQMEIDMLIEIGAKTRGRYISKLLEIGRANKALSFSATEEVRGLREQHEEIIRGLDLLREALERGEIEIEGVEII